MKRILALLVSILLILSLSGCKPPTPDPEGSKNTESLPSAASESPDGGHKTDEPSAEASPSPTPIPITVMEPMSVSVETPDVSGACDIVLDGTNASISGGGAAFSDGDIIISDGGTYRIKGSLSDGRLIINAEKKPVSIVLEGADIACSDSSALYVHSAERTLL